jgi:hypothetical protein
MSPEWAKPAKEGQVNDNKNLGGEAIMGKGAKLAREGIYVYKQQISNGFHNP